MRDEDEDGTIGRILQCREEGILSTFRQTVCISDNTNTESPPCRIAREEYPQFPNHFNGDHFLLGHAIFLLLQRLYQSDIHHGTSGEQTREFLRHQKFPDPVRTGKNIRLQRRVALCDTQEQFALFFVTDNIHIRNW
jgi:hypothetical protein